MLPPNPYDYEISDSIDYLPTTTLSVLTFFSVVSLLFLKSLIFFKSSSNSNQEKERITSFDLSFQSIHPLLYELFQLGLILLYVWICENRPVYAHGSKWHEIDFFYFLSFGLIAASLFTLKVNHKENDDLLNRDQTEEWKGWMQVMFLLYHYFHVGEVYNLIRALISCYVWMTGFGNFSFFYIKQDFSFVRFYQMMWRLNFFVFFLCLTTNNLYMLYYICPLHTFYFLLTFVSMYFFQYINHTKYMIRWKLLLVGVLIFLVWEFEEVYNLVFFFLSDTPHPGYAVGRYGIKYEWHFRSGLDHYSTYFGMIFAVNFPQVTLWIKQVENLSIYKQIFVKGFVGIILSSLTYYYFSEIYTLPKLEYNSFHPYVFIFPVMTYIYLRNSTFWLRTRRAVLLEKIGKVTLETYLLQHHAWLTSNAKTLLVFLPGYPKVNFLVVTVIYLALSQKMYRLTINLRARCIPEDKQNAINSAFILIICFVLFYSVSWVLQLFQISWYIYFIFVLMLSAVLNSVIDFIFKSKSFFTNTKNKNLVTRSLFILSIILTIVLVSLMNFNVTKVPDDDIGPFRPYAASFNTDYDCLNQVNDFTLRNFDYNKVEKPQEMLINEDIVFKFNHLNSKAEKSKCKTFAYEPRETLNVLKGRKILFTGNENMKDIALAFINEFNIGTTSLGKFVSRNRNYKDYTNSEEDILVSIARENVHKRTNVYDVIVFDISALDKGPLSPANENIYYSNRTALQSQNSQYELISKFIRENYSKNYIFITPKQDTFNPNLVTRLLAQEFLSIKIGIVDLYKLNKLDLSDLNENDVQKIGAQLLVNNLDILFKSIDNSLDENNRLLLEIESKKKAGSGGGVAINPLYGFYVLILSAITLFSFDSYFGVAALTKMLVDRQASVSWEESVAELHMKIGVTKDRRNTEEKDVEALKLLS